MVSQCFAAKDKKSNDINCKLSMCKNPWKSTGKEND